MPPRGCRERRTGRNTPHERDDDEDQRAKGWKPVSLDSHYLPPLRDVAFDPYLFCACDSQTLRLRLLFLAWHALNARASLCARLDGLALRFTTGPVDPAVTFPAPENVALDGDPKTDGCGEGAALHESAVAHGGGTAAATGKHGATPVHSCASYTSSAVSKSCDTSLAVV